MHGAVPGSNVGPGSDGVPDPRSARGARRRSCGGVGRRQAARGAGGAGVACQRAGERGATGGRAVGRGRAGGRGQDGAGHVSRLRKALGDTGVLETTPAGYRLGVGPGELDAERFERAAGGRAARRWPPGDADARGRAAARGARSCGAGRRWRSSRGRRSRRRRSRGWRSCGWARWRRGWRPTWPPGGTPSWWPSSSG